MQYCREMKVIEAFGWANFAICTLCLVHLDPQLKALRVMVSFMVLLTLIFRAQAFGHPYAWRSLALLPWFGQGHGFSYGFPGQPMYTPLAQHPPNMPAFTASGQPIIYQAPGHAVVVSNNPAGGGPIVQQIPAGGGPGSGIGIPGAPLTQVPLSP